MLPLSPSTTLTVVLPVSVFLLEASWYFLVALALSASAPRAAYLRAKLAVDRVAGAALAALGIRLLVSAR
jgi:threonine/homoserine/homoserine lactone efflux protein